MKHTLLWAMALAAGCSFNPGKDTLDMSGGGDGGDDMSTGDDMTQGPDMTMICTPGQKTCTGGMLSTCNLDGTGIDTVACVLGCNAAGNDCAALQPTAPAVASDFAYAGLSEPTITQPLLVFDTDTGEIKDGAGATVRMPNAAPMTRNVENGIGFHNVSGVGIWTFSKLTVPATTTIVFKHPSAASILSAGDLSIAGTIDARGYADPTKALMAGTMSTLCMGTVAGPGGTVGGVTVTPPAGEGSPGNADGTAGGGGGSYGEVGAAGGNNGGSKGGMPGATSGTAAINPLGGGFGGGSGSTSGTGGGGGGAVQLAAEGTLTISGTINAGGCGGAAGGVALGGGGGGSGGAILVEAPTVHLTAASILAANGGGGGGGGGAMETAGEAGNAATPPSPANGGAGAGGHNGGSGAALGSTAGVGNNGLGAGGGGGGVGRVRLNARTAGGTVDNGSTISPAQSAGTVVIQ